MKRVICLLLITAALSAAAGAANQVGITPRGNFINDTIRADYPGWFELSIANDLALGGISLGFIISGDAEYEFLDAENGFTTNPPGPNFIEGIPGSRWMNGAAPDGSCWDLGGTHVDYDPNGSLPNQFLIGGAALGGNLVSGPLQPMLKINYRVSCTWYNYPIRHICIDSMKYMPAGDFIFTPGGTPQVLWGGTPLCFPIISMCGLCPEWDNDIPTSLTVGTCGTGQVTLSASDPEGGSVYYYLIDVIGGSGTATVGLHDGVVTYTPDPSDGGTPITIEVEATDDIYRQHGCAFNPWSLEVNIVNNAPAISCGNTHNIVGSGELFRKFDITSSDPDSCDGIQYELTSINPSAVGSCSVDPVTGIFSFYTDANDGGIDYEVCVQASDGIDAASSCFNVAVCNCDLPGEIDGTYDINIGDAVALIAFIFKGAVGPVNMNWADTNADCAVNVADAVYLINYIFKGGPAPQAGCYY